jgi:hypothetical protein
MFIYLITNRREMMIKLQFWNHDAKEFMQIPMAVTGGGVILAETESGWFPIDVQEAVTVRRYTGLKDRNGTEIHESDVLYTQVDGEFTAINVTFEVDRDFNGWNVTPQDAELGRVAGNIYENPKLLK